MNYTLIQQWRKSSPLIHALVSRDLKVKYRRSILGYLWSLLNPLLMMTIMTRGVGIFPNSVSYVRLVTTYLMEYSEDCSVSHAYIRTHSLADVISVAV